MPTFILSNNENIIELYKVELVEPGLKYFGERQESTPMQINFKYCGLNYNHRTLELHAVHVVVDMAKMYHLVH